MTDERGTGDIGKKPKSKKTKVAIFIIAVLGLGVLSPFILPMLDTPAEKVSDVVELNNDGVSAREAEAVAQKMQHAAKIAKNTSARAVISTNTTEKVETVVEQTLDTPQPLIQAENKASPDNAEIVPAALVASDSTDMLPFAAQENAVIPVDDQNTPGQSEDKTAVSAEELILSSAMPATDNKMPAVPSEIASTPTDTTSNSSQQTIQPDISTVSGSEITSFGQPIEPNGKNETLNDNDSKPSQQFKPEDFGITDEQTQQVQTAEIQHQVRQSRVNNEPIAEYGQAYRFDESNNQLKNYVGEAKEAEYQMQDQNTVYLYSNFAAKIYLLPLDKNDTVNAYLSDPKGWEVKLLPGGIFRINRSDDKAKWTQATDLFIIAGKRTYTIILQGVGEPSIRTDSLRYHLPKTDVKKAR